MKTRSLCVIALLPATLARAGTDQYTATILGTPDGAGTTTAIRMNNLGHVVGYSIYYSQGEPSLRGWVWTEADGFTVLPAPPDMFLGRSRAMDISDTGIIAGDGGFDSGIAWRYQDGVYETFGAIEGLSIAYLGAVNDAGDVAGTSKDSQITTPDLAFLDLNGGGTVNLTPGSGGRATDLNNAGQVCGYSQGGGFQAVIWDADSGMQFLGAAGLAYSFANDMNDAGQVVGRAQSASGNTVNSWLYTPGAGQQVLPMHGAAAINNAGQVAGTNTCCGPDDPWIWTPQTGLVLLIDLFHYPSAGLSGPNLRDINDAGQILANAYDNTAGGFRPVLLTPLAAGLGACCLAGGGCLEDLGMADCVSQDGTFLGNGTACTDCAPVGACCLTNGNCLAFMPEADCAALLGTYQGEGTSCAIVSCVAGVPNDDCADAIAIEPGDTPFTTLGAVTDGPTTADPCGGSFTFGQDIWYLYEPAGDGTLVVSTCNQADFDTKLGAYTGSCDSLEFLACNDDATGCLALTSLMEVPVTCGEPVRIRVGGFSTQSGLGTLTVSFEGEPCEAGCPGDTNGDQSVDVQDLINIVAAWGTNGQGPGVDADLNDDGRVDVADLIVVIGAWGVCG